VNNLTILSHYRVCSGKWPEFILIDERRQVYWSSKEKHGSNNSITCSLLIALDSLTVYPITCRTHHEGSKVVNSVFTAVNYQVQNSATGDSGQSIPSPEGKYPATAGAVDTTTSYTVWKMTHTNFGWCIQ